PRRGCPRRITGGAAGMTFDTPDPADAGVSCSDARDRPAGRHAPSHPMPRRGPEIQVTVKKPQALLLSLAVSLALSACTGDKADNPAAADATANANAPGETQALTL